MKLPVLIESVNDRGYVARVGPPFNWSAEGGTPEEAISRLQQEANRHLANGQKVATIDVPDAEHPWKQLIGSWDPNDPLIQEWKKGIEEYRRQRDRELLAEESDGS
jgi:predicted RNase H-like HicB family nuclease